MRTPLLPSHESKSRSCTVIATVCCFLAFVAFISFHRHSIWQREEALGFIMQQLAANYPPPSNNPGLNGALQRGGFDPAAFQNGRYDVILNFGPRYSAEPLSYARPWSRGVWDVVYALANGQPFKSQLDMHIEGSGYGTKQSKRPGGAIPDTLQYYDPKYPTQSQDWPYARDDLERLTYQLGTNDARPISCSMLYNGGWGTGETKYGVFVMVLDRNQIDGVTLFGDSLQQWDRLSRENGGRRPAADVLRDYQHLVAPLDRPDLGLPKLYYGASTLPEGFSTYIEVQVNGPITDNKVREYRIKCDLEDPDSGYGTDKENYEDYWDRDGEKFRDPYVKLSLFCFLKAYGHKTVIYKWFDVQGEGAWNGHFGPWGTVNERIESDPEFRSCFGFQLAEIGLFDQADCPSGGGGDFEDLEEDSEDSENMTVLDNHTQADIKPKAEEVVDPYQQGVTQDEVKRRIDEYERLHPAKKPIVPEKKPGMDIKTKWSAPDTKNKNIIGPIEFNDNKAASYTAWGAKLQLKGDWSTWRVVEVESGGSFSFVGVRSEWKIVAVNGKEPEKMILKKKQKCTITFETNDPDDVLTIRTVHNWRDSWGEVEWHTHGPLKTWRILSVQDGTHLSRKGVRNGWPLLRVDHWDLQTADQKFAEIELKLESKSMMTLAFRMGSDPPKGHLVGPIAFKTDSESSWGVTIDPESFIVSNVDSYSALGIAGVQNGWEIVETNEKEPDKDIISKKQACSLTFKPNDGPDLITIRTAPNRHDSWGNVKWDMEGPLSTWKLVSRQEGTQLARLGIQDGAQLMRVNMWDLSNTYEERAAEVRTMLDSKGAMTLTFKKILPF